MTKQIQTDPTTSRLADILGCCDTIALTMLSVIETAEALGHRADRRYVMEELGITRKQFYARSTVLIKQGIIKHRLGTRVGPYVLTNFGKIITGKAFRLINTCIGSFSELQAIEFLDTKDWTREEYVGFVKRLLKDSELQELVLRGE
jgi:hypothetical protein